MTGNIADTHLALWLIDGSDRLPDPAKKIMCSPGETWYISIVSIWEVMLKHQVHPEQLLIDAQTFLFDCEAAGFRLLRLEAPHIFEASRLPLVEKHKDPFDRMLLAQARSENMMLVTHDSLLGLYEDPHILLV